MEKISHLESRSIVGLAEDSIHVWMVKLEVLAAKLSFYKSLLSDDEHKRSERFKLEKHRRYFILARGLLRQLLARYCNISPQKLIFGYTSRGKPYLIYPNYHKKLVFNISHAEGCAMLGFGCGINLGVDIELLSRRVDCLGLAGRYFSNKEYQALLTLPDYKRQLTFLEIWVQKEAVLKAMGVGITFPLKDVVVDVINSHWQSKAHIKHSFYEKKIWTVRKFINGKKWVAAVATEGQIKSLTKFSLCG